MIKNFQYDTNKIHVVYFFQNISSSIIIHVLPKVAFQSNCALAMSGTANGDAMSRCRVLGRAGSVIFNFLHFFKLCKASNYVIASPDWVPARMAVGILFTLRMMSLYERSTVMNILASAGSWRGMSGALNILSR